MTSLEETVRDWISADPDVRCREELTALLESGDLGELRRRFDSPLTFGTAGLRGPVQAGPAGMNPLTVRRVSEAVSQWLHSLGPLVSDRGVVVGRDGRNGSEAFFGVVVSILRQAGLTVYGFDRPLPTPLVSFAVRHLSAAAGIMITASHNPAVDNGLKLYDASGSQIISPTDSLIEQYCSQIELQRVTLPEIGTRKTLGDEVIAAYVQSITAPYLSTTASSLRVAYSALHGVGASIALRALGAAGFSNVTSVAAQNDPDGTFPTAPFPNPEESGAMDLLLTLARDINADLALINDPDADRLGAAIVRNGQWQSLGGDEIGWLLADAAIARGVSALDVFATTIVSSSLLAKMVERAGATYVETLTGFKWIARAGSLSGSALRFGYEEALGYAVNSNVADKDGISAAVALARRAVELSAVNSSLAQRLDELAALYGPHEVDQISLRVEGIDARDRVERALQDWRTSSPKRLGGLVVSEVIDLEVGYRGLPPTSGLLIRLGDVARVIVRPSGTEAKLKVYLEVTGAPATIQSLDSERTRTKLQLEKLRADVAHQLVL